MIDNNYLRFLYFSASLLKLSQVLFLQHNVKMFLTTRQYKNREVK